MAHTRYTAHMLKSLMLLVLLGAGVAASAATYEPRVTEATLYTQQVAQVIAEVTVEGGSPVVLSLPGKIEPDSVEVSLAAGGAITTSMTPVEGKAPTPMQPPPIVEYRCTVQGIPAGNRTLTVKYMVEDLGWSPGYTLKIAPDGSAQLTIAPTIKNHAVNLEKVTLKLVSGKLQGRYAAGMGEYPEGLADYLEALDSSGAFSGRLSGMLGSDLPAPPSPGNIQDVTELTGQTIPQGSSLRLSPVSAPVTVDDKLIWDASTDYSGGSSERIIGVYRFLNTAEEPLAEGLVHVERAGMAMGDARVGFTAPGQPAVLLLGGAKGFVVKKSQEDIPVADTWETRQVYTLRLENHTKAEASIVVGDSPSQVRYPFFNDGGSGQAHAFQYDPQPDRLGEGWVSWSFRLPAGATRELRYEYRTALDTSQIALLHFTCDGGPSEARYLFSQEGTAASEYGWRRVVDTGNVIYALPIPENIRQADLVLRLSDNSYVSLASDDRGKPGAFRPVFDGVGMQSGPNYERRASTYYYFDLQPYLESSHMVYVKVDNGARDSAVFAGVSEVEVDPLPAGYNSRGQVYPLGPAPKTPSGFVDDLRGGTVGVPRPGDRYVTLGPDGLTLNDTGSWVKYKDLSQTLPSRAGTIAVRLMLHPGCQPGRLISDAYEMTSGGILGTTWPSFNVEIVRADDSHFRLFFSYWNANAPNNWVGMTSEPTLETGRWYDLGITWGPQGQSIWVDGQQWGHSDFAGPYQHGANTARFGAWGLGNTFNQEAPRSEDPSGPSASPVTFSDLLVSYEQLEKGGTSAPGANANAQ